MTLLPNTPFRHCPPADHGTRRLTVGVVIHDIEGSAEGAESWFHNPRCGGVGAHVIVGLSKVVQVVDLDNKCWHAVAANAGWIGIEHEGRSTDSRETWIKRRLQRKLSANRTAWICWKYKLGQPTWGENVRSHSSGGEAWGNHDDPGPGFPRDLYIAAARRAYRNLVASKGKRWTRLPSPVKR